MPRSRWRLARPARAEERRGVDLCSSGSWWPIQLESVEGDRIDPGPRPPIANRPPLRRSDHEVVPHQVRVELEEGREHFVRVVSGSMGRSGSTAIQLRPRPTPEGRECSAEVSGLVRARSPGRWIPRCATGGEVDCGATVEGSHRTSVPPPPPAPAGTGPESNRPRASDGPARPPPGTGRIGGGFRDILRTGTQRRTGPASDGPRPSRGILDCSSTTRASTTRANSSMSPCPARVADSDASGTISPPGRDSGQGRPGDVPHPGSRPRGRPPRPGGDEAPRGWLNRGRVRARGTPHGADGRNPLPLSDFAQVEYPQIFVGRSRFTHRSRLRASRLPRGSPRAVLEGRG